MGAFADFHDFSFRGDERWYRASSFTRWAPLVVIWIFVLSVLEVIFGSIWLVQIKSNLQIAQVIHTLVIPGLSFFNAVPSLHLHMLLRKNSPTLAMAFSYGFALMFFIMSLMLILACNMAEEQVSPTVRRHICARSRIHDIPGADTTIWALVVACFMMSFLLYALHGIMATRVFFFLKREEAAERANPRNHELSVLSEQDRIKAKELWRHQGRYEF